MQTYKQFAKRHGIRLECEKIVARPDGIMDRDMDHWKCRLRRPAGAGLPKIMTVYFSMGYGHKGAEPTVDDVLNSLALDASGYENAEGDFQMWADEYGYEFDDWEDRRKVGKIFGAVKRETEKLKRFLGEHYHELLYETEE